MVSVVVVAVVILALVAFLRFDLVEPESLSSSREFESLFLSSLWILSEDLVLFEETLSLLTFALDVWKYWFKRPWKLVFLFTGTSKSLAVSSQSSGWRISACEPIGVLLCCCQRLVRNIVGI